MMDHMHMLKWAFCILEGNVREARKYIAKAHEMRTENRTAADWCRDMAQSHLQFNVAGQSVFDRTMNDLAATGEHAVLIPGIKAVYEERMHDLTQETAEIKAMIEMYTK